MSKTIIYPALLSILLATGCAYSAKQQPPASTKICAERITVHGLSQDIITEAKQIAAEHCQEQNKQFTFMRNIFRKKTLLGLDWLTCDLYFACLAEGEKLPALPAHHTEPDEITPDTEAHHDAPEIDAGKNEPPKEVKETPDNAKQPTKSTAVLRQTQYPAFDQKTGVGELESLGSEPLRPGDAQPAAEDQCITVEILK